MTILRPGTALLALLTLTLPAAAQGTPARTAEQQFVLAPGEHDLRTVITAAAAYLGRNLMLSDRELQAEPKVVLQVGMKLDREGCFAVVSQLAYTHGLVLSAIDRDRELWEFINAAGPRRNELMMRAPALSLEQARALKGVRTYITCVIPIQHVRATAMVQTLRPFFATGGTNNLALGAPGSDSAVVISGMVDDVLNAAASIAAIDQPRAEREPTPTERITELEAKVAGLEAKVSALEAKQKNG